MDVTFDYWTNLCYCCGSNVGGTCTIDLTEDELKQRNILFMVGNQTKYLDDMFRGILS